MILVNGIEVNPPEFLCEKCGNDELSFKYLPSNKSIQMRCAACGAWNGNYKYDARPQSQIRREIVDEWVKNKVKVRSEQKV